MVLSPPPSPNIRQKGVERSSYNSRTRRGASLYLFPSHRVAGGITRASKGRKIMDSLTRRHPQGTWTSHVTGSCAPGALAPQGRPITSASFMDVVRGLVHGQGQAASLFSIKKLNPRGATWPGRPPIDRQARRCKCCSPLPTKRGGL